MMIYKTPPILEADDNDDDVLRVNDSYCFLLPKNEAVNNRHFTKNVDVTRFWFQNCFVEYTCTSCELPLSIFPFLANCALINRKSFPFGGGGSGY